MARTKSRSATRASAKNAGSVKSQPVMTAVPSYTSSTASNPYSLNSFLSWINNNFAIIFFVGVFFIAGFTSGSLWTQNQMIKKGVGGGTGAVPTADRPTVPEGPTQEQLKTVPEVTGEDHILGNRNAQVLLVEYSDFECPFCARFHPTMQSIKETYGDDVAWVYRHYPLPFHPNAQKAAEASECVAELGGEGKFWEFGDSIIEKNNEMGGRLSPDAILEVATEIGINEGSFKACLDSGKYAQKVSDHMAGGSKAGVNGTPGTVVITKDGNYDFISGAVPEADVKAVVDKYLN
jgi:protein-disulfide isomerase